MYNKLKNLINNKLKSYNISLEQYLILSALNAGDNDFLDDYENQFKIRTIDSTKNLYDRELIQFVKEFPDSEKEQYNAIDITDEGNNLLDKINEGDTNASDEEKTEAELTNFKSKFQELWGVFPTSDKVPHLHDRSRALKQDRKRCEKYYKDILKEGNWSHDTIINCLKFEIEDRMNKSTTQENKLKYMKAMPAWLNSRMFESYYDIMVDESGEKTIEHPDEQELGLEDE